MSRICVDYDPIDLELSKSDEVKIARARVGTIVKLTRGRIGQWQQRTDHCGGCWFAEVGKRSRSFFCNGPDAYRCTDKNAVFVMSNQPASDAARGSK